MSFRVRSMSPGDIGDTATRADSECRLLRGRRQGDIGYWGVGGRRLVALLLGADDRCASLGRLRIMALGAM
jgi:hypothetical protein